MRFSVCVASVAHTFLLLGVNIMRFDVLGLRNMRWVVFSVLLLMAVGFFYGCEGSNSVSMVTCMECGKNWPAEYTFCSNCGQKLGTPIVSEQEALLGTWEAYDDPWGRYTYTFYPDGYCMGEYHGGTGSVLPSLYPNSYYVGAGDGTWTFEQGELIPVLKISYQGDKWGDHVGTQRYEYAFNEDFTELTIYGVDTHGDRERGSIVWKKISE